MKKVSCPKCKNKWDEDEPIKFTVEGVIFHRFCYAKVKDFIFCPECFFKTKGKVFEYPESYECKLDRVILKTE